MHSLLRNALNTINPFRLSSVYAGTPKRCRDNVTAQQHDAILHEQTIIWLHFARCGTLVAQAYSRLPERELYFTPHSGIFIM